MFFELLDLKPRNPYLALAIDEAIALFYGKLRHEGFRGGLRMWANHPSIVFGLTCRPEENLHPSVIEEFGSRSLFSRVKSEQNKNTPFICRRTSGGGTVLHGPGNINYSIYLSLTRNPELFSVKNSYEKILGIVRRALDAQGLHCEVRGQSDLVIADDSGMLKKISGNSQFRKYGILVHHGTLITRSTLIENIHDQLLHPPKEPDYREKRTHRDFLGSLPDTFDFSSFYGVLSRELTAQFAESEIKPLALQDKTVILRAARRLVKETYARKEWIIQGRVLPVKESVRNYEVLENILLNRVSKSPVVELLNEGR